MIKSYKKLAIILAFVFVLLIVGQVGSNVAYATEDTAITTTAAPADQQEAPTNVAKDKAYSSAIAIGLAALGAAVGMGMSIAKATEGISRQPEAEGKIRTTLMLGMVFIETVVIYALIIAILIIFVL